MLFQPGNSNVRLCACTLFSRTSCWYSKVRADRTMWMFGVLPSPLTRLSRTLSRFVFKSRCAASASS